MKKITIILVVCLLCATATVSAQFTNSSSAGASQSSDLNGWSGIRVSYSPMQVKSDGETDSFRGLSAGFVKGFRLASQSPVFMEVGANFLWSNSSEDDYDTEINLNMYSINVPLNIGYRYSINEEFSIFPYAGITARGNISGKFTASYDGEKESLNIFDEDDMGDDYTFNRFQVGWQIGFGVNLNRFYLSASFGTDFNELAKDLKISSIPSVTLGINF